MAETKIDPYSRNPLLDKARAESAFSDIKAKRGGAPTMFAAGDVPPCTASGNPPSELLKLPACIRHKAAKADQQEWARLFAEYGPGVADADLAAKMFEPVDDGWYDYEVRVQAWARS